MSHVKNMQAFGKLTGICTGLGGTYNPGQQNLQANAMAAQLNIAQQAWEEMKEAQKAYDNATNQREEGFEKIRKLSSSVYSMLKACQGNKLLREDALNYKRRICRARISPPPDTGTSGTDEQTNITRSSYSQSFLMVAEYFDGLVKTVASEPNYRANEPELSLPGLQQTLTELFQLNQAVRDAEIRLEKARIQRNLLYYIAPNNLVDTALAVKAYVRSVFGYQSQQHLQVVKINFIKPQF